MGIESATQGSTAPIAISTTPEPVDSTRELSLRCFVLHVAFVTLLAAVAMQLAVLVNAPPSGFVDRRASESLIAATACGIFVFSALGLVGLGDFAKARGLKLFLHGLAVLLLAFGVLMTLLYYFISLYLGVGATVAVLGVAYVWRRARSVSPGFSLTHYSPLKVFASGVLALGALFLINSGPTPASATVEACGDQHFFRVGVSSGGQANWGWQMYGLAPSLDPELVQHLEDNDDRLDGYADNDGFWSEHLNDEVEWGWVDGSAICFDSNLEFEI